MANCGCLRLACRQIDADCVIAFMPADGEASALGPVLLWIVKSAV